MGVTGANGFPCCSKDSVDVTETPSVINQDQQAQEEDQMENELLELEPPRDMDLDLGSELELEMDLDAEAVPQLEPCLTPEFQPTAYLDANVETNSEDSEQQGYRIESLHPYPEDEGGPAQWDATLWSESSRSSCLCSLEEEEVSTAHRSIHLQTSKHLFWADKLIQTSEHSLHQEINLQHGKKSTGKTTSNVNQEPDPTDTLCSEKQLQNPSTQPAGSQQPPSAHPSSSSLPPTISLADLISLASSVTMASSSTMDLPNWEHMMKAPPQKTTEPSTAPMVERATQPAEDKPERKTLSDLLERPPEKPLDAAELQKVRKQEDENFFHPSPDFSKPGLQRAAIEGNMKLLPSSTVSLTPKGDRKE
ncbi:spermatogenesis-associated protein 32 [Rhinolophus ferrumequinum]|uniref:spermatogenesis-associated protein 32 n=1 Tax=Rhinolophus ferrumequinum TaxID=59479 RepID=UPI00140FC3E7|nr:spermatogenesis-associated protein 32 [Rhinolophus ferrumequinum]